MASITVRGLDERVKQHLQRRAAKRGHSLEQEVRDILHREGSKVGRRKEGLGQAIQRRFAAFGGIELPLPLRRGRKVPDLG